MLNTLGKNFSRQLFEIFFLFFPKIGFDILCKLSPMETICIKCQILFSGKNTKNVISLSSAELGQRVITFNVISGVHLTLKDLLPPSTYFRFNPYVSENCELDEIRPEKIRQMQQDAKLYSQKNETKLMKAVEQLKLSRLPHRRALDFINYQRNLRVTYPLKHNQHCWDDILNFFFIFQENKIYISCELSA